MAEFKISETFRNAPAAFLQWHFYAFYTMKYRGTKHPGQGKPQKSFVDRCGSGLYDKLMRKFELIVPCHFGLESVLKKEIIDLGYDISSVTDGRVTFLGDVEAVCRANIFLRTAERVLIQIGCYRVAVRNKPSVLHGYAACGSVNRL